MKCCYFMDEIKGRRFGRGEGVVVLQGSKLRFIKVLAVRDERRIRQLCTHALGCPPVPL